MSVADMLLRKDVGRDQARLSKLGSRLAGGKKTGGGLGGLIGSIGLPALGLLLAPFTGGLSAALLGNAALMGAVGGGLGSIAGSAIGGKASGVDQDDILKGKFGAGTRGEITKDISKSTFNDALKSAVMGGVKGGRLAKGKGGFGQSFFDNTKQMGTDMSGGMGFGDAFKLNTGEMFRDMGSKFGFEPAKEYLGSGKMITADKATGLTSGGLVLPDGTQIGSGAFNPSASPVSPDMGSMTSNIPNAPVSSPNIVPPIEALPGNITGDASLTEIPGLNLPEYGPQNEDDFGLLQNVTGGDWDWQTDHFDQYINKGWDE